MAYGGFYMDEKSLLARVGAFAKAARRAEFWAQYVRETPISDGKGGETYPFRDVIAVRVVPAPKGDTLPYTFEVWVAADRIGQFCTKSQLSRLDAFGPQQTESCMGAVQLTDMARKRIWAQMWHNLPREAKQGRDKELKKWDERELTLTQLRPRGIFSYRLFRPNLSGQLEGYFRAHPETAKPLALELDAAIGGNRYARALGIEKETLNPRQDVDAGSRDRGDLYPDGREDASIGAGGRWVDRFPTQNASRADIGMSL
jgi:hypothetical protein